MEKERCFSYPDENWDFQNKIERIYDSLVDAESIDIFQNRFMYSMTRDYRYMNNMVSKISAGKMFVDTLRRKCQGGGIIIYGAGIKGTRLVNLFPEVNWIGYIDKELEGTVCNGLPVYGLNKCKEITSTILISNTMNYMQIKNDLIELGIEEQQRVMLRAYDLIESENIYFDSSVMSPNMLDAQKYFVDAGCYDGNDTQNYFDFIQDSHALVYAIEPDKKNYLRCRDRLSKYENTVVENLGIADEENVVNFDQTNTSSSKFCEMGEDSVRIRTIDSIFLNKEVGMIKMDIEGYEEKAILGAAETIKRCHPILALSIYHKQSDIWKLPSLLLELNPDYKFYLRHYTVGVTDTVIYAI